MLPEIFFRDRGARIAWENIGSLDCSFTVIGKIHLTSTFANHFITSPPLSPPHLSRSTRFDIGGIGDHHLLRI